MTHLTNGTFEIIKDRTVFSSEPMEGPTSGPVAPIAPAFNLGVAPGQGGGQAPTLQLGGAKPIVSPEGPTRLTTREMRPLPRTGQAMLPAEADALKKSADNLLLAFIVGLTVLGAAAFLGIGR